MIEELAALRLTLIRIGFLGAAYGQGDQKAPLLKICDTYLTIMKLDSYAYKLHFDTQFLIILTFLESLKIILINMVKVLMISAKMATPGLFEI